MRLYHYTTVESFMKIWLSGKLKLSPLDRQNDILESHKPFTSAGFYPEKMKVIKETLESFKQLSFTMDYKHKLGYMSTMMWGQYADKGNGVCIELDYESLKLDTYDCLHGKVKYVRNFPSPPSVQENANDKMSIKKHIIRNKKHFFFTKLDDWKPENEYRVVSDSPEVEYINISHAVTNIWIAICKQDVREMIQELCSDDGKHVGRIWFRPNGKVMKVDVSHYKR